MTIRIMPLGDSITLGTHGVIEAYYDGYRYPLYTMLRSAGVDFNFVGDSASGSPGFPDQEYQAVVGGKLSDMATGVAGYLAANPADLILCIGATNEIVNGFTGEETADHLRSLLAAIYSVAPTAPVLFGVPPKTTTTDLQHERWQRFRMLAPGVIGAAVAAGQTVRLLDFGEIERADTIGHPTTAGYAVMANVWLRALLTLPIVVPSPRWRGI